MRRGGRAVIFPGAYGPFDTLEAAETSIRAGAGGVDAPGAAAAAPGRFAGRKPAANRAAGTRRRGPEEATPMQEAFPPLPDRGGVLRPMLVVAAVLSYIFVFGEKRDHFYWLHDWSSSLNLSVAVNLSPDHNFLGFEHRFVGSLGDPEYALYNRFPIGAAVLTKLAIAPFEGDLSAQIFAAKTLSVLLFCGAALLAFLALGRLFRDRWGAAAAVLLAFSSWYALMFADLVGEGMVSLFGVMLAFHGLVVFAREGRFLQLLGKTCAALLLGWHVAGLVLAFVALSAGASVIGRAAGRRPAFGRIALYGGASFVFAVFVMSVNFFNEYRLHGYQGAFTDLPSVESALSRTGIFERYGVRNVETMIDIQKRTIAFAGKSSIPFAFFDLGADTARGAARKAPVDLHAMGLVVLATVGAGLFFVGRRIVVASFVLSGFVYAAIVPFNLNHDHEAVHYIPISLFFYFLIVRLVRRVLDPRFASALCIVSAAAIFGASNVKMSKLTEAAPRVGGGIYVDAHRQFGDSREASAFHETMLRDFDTIRLIAPRGAKIYVTTGRKIEERVAFGAYAALYIYLSGYLVNHDDYEFREGTEYHPDFVLSLRRFDSPFLLTPGNGAVFLYDGAAWRAAAAGSSRPNSARAPAQGGR